MKEHLFDGKLVIAEGPDNLPPRVRVGGMTFCGQAAVDAARRVFKLGGGLQSAVQACMDAVNGKMSLEVSELAQVLASSPRGYMHPIPAELLDFVPTFGADDHVRYGVLPITLETKREGWVAVDMVIDLACGGSCILRSSGTVEVGGREFAGPWRLQLAKDLLLPPERPASERPTKERLAAVMKTHPSCIRARGYRAGLVVVETLGAGNQGHVRIRVQDAEWVVPESDGIAGTVFSMLTSGASVVQIRRALQEPQERADAATRTKQFEGADDGRYAVCVCGNAWRPGTSATKCGACGRVEKDALKRPTVLVPIETICLNAALRVHLAESALEWKNRAHASEIKRVAVTSFARGVNKGEKDAATKLALLDRQKDALVRELDAERVARVAAETSLAAIRAQQDVERPRKRTVTTTVRCAGGKILSREVEVEELGPGATVPVREDAHVALEPKVDMAKVEAVVREDLKFARARRTERIIAVVVGTTLCAASVAFGVFVGGPALASVLRGLGW